MRNGVAALVAIALIGAQSVASGQPIADHGVSPLEQPPAGTKYFDARKLKQRPTGATPQLRGGAVAKTDDWPATLVATFMTSEGPASCTMALVGGQAVLTAAHCVPAGGTRIDFEFAGDDYAADCTIPAAYPADPSADFALCKVTKPIKPVPGLLYESIEMTGTLADRLQSTVLLTGYGCISDLVANTSKIDGLFRIGTNKIVETSLSTNGARGLHYYAPVQRNNLITSNASAYANLCPGDSGGPAYRLVQSSRTIIAVNSRVFYADADKKNYDASLLSATNGPNFAEWARDWAKKMAKVDVCGIYVTKTPCRQ